LRDGKEEESEEGEAGDEGPGPGTGEQVRVIVERIAPRDWPDCIVAATGPSLTEAVADQCRSQRVIAVNDAYRRLPWADVLYAGDADWWGVHEGCPDFTGEKWSAHHPRHNDKRDVAVRYGVRLVAGPDVIDAPGFSLDPARLHYGNSSGFQAINLAILFGATRVILVGFDMRVPAGAPRHFFGDHPAPLGNAAKYEQFLPAFERAAQLLPPHIRIVNCTPGSALQCFPMAPLEAELMTETVR
jgi:hypothetical protein